MAATCNVSALVAAAPKVCVRTTAKVHASRAFLGRAAPLKAQVAGSTKGAQRLVVRADSELSPLLSQPALPPRAHRTRADTRPLFISSYAVLWGFVTEST